MKRIIILLIIFTVLTGCTTVPTTNQQNEINTEPLVTKSTTNKITAEPTLQMTDTPISTEIPAIGHDPSRVVEAIGESYDDFENMTSQNRNKLGTFNIEMCYFKMKNIPEEMKAIYVSLWEVAFLAFYENPKTEETFKFHWWADKKPEDYTRSIIEDVRNVEIIQKNGNDYFCKFSTVVKEPSDTTESDMNPYRVDIRWVENGKCFYINIHSSTPLDESALKYCELEKFTIE